jgi:hypothetical protein
MSSSPTAASRGARDVGYRTGDQYDIPDGLKAGDQIVVDGASLFNSCKINERPLPPTGSAPRTASMMNRIVASSLRQRFLVVLLTLVLIGAGTRSLERLPVDAYPDLSPPMSRSSPNGPATPPRKWSG